ncbi:predicted protein [Botrytis cinerea T4]|uniref:Uncharacterized protein n=1 Tax=Botryotinia fuckeliana (strain T4) TaxID=999810 RepID=G2XTP9_BOTF4|nr:predicted protein [Botrytis cinerea T4]
MKDFIPSLPSVFEPFPLPDNLLSGPPITGIKYPLIIIINPFIKGQTPISHQTLQPMK